MNWSKKSVLVTGASGFIGSHLTLDNLRVEEIVKNAHELINTKYTYEVVVENYRKLLMDGDKKV